MPKFRSQVTHCYQVTVNNHDFVTRTQTLPAIKPHRKHIIFYFPATFTATFSETCTENFNATLTATSSATFSATLSATFTATFGLRRA